MLIAKPSFLFPDEIASYPPLYCLAALTAACLVGVGYTAQRGLGASVHPCVTTFWLSMTIIVGGVIVNLVTGDDYALPDCYAERAILFACGVGTCIALACLNAGLALEKGAPATLMRNMDIVLAFLAQVFLFREELEWRSVVGALLIVTSAASVALERALCPDYFWKI